MPGRVLDLASTRWTPLGGLEHLEPRRGVMVFLGVEASGRRDVICLDLLTMKQHVVGQVPDRGLKTDLSWTGPLTVTAAAPAADDQPAFTSAFTCPPASDPSRPVLRPVQSVPGATFAHRGGPARSSVFGPDESGGRDLHGTPRWTFKVGAAVMASVTIAGNLALLGDHGGTLHALDLVMGQPVWQVRLGGKIRAAAAAASGLVVVGTADRAVHGLDLRTGAARWKVEVGGPVVSTPLVDGGVAYVGSHDGRLRALDLATGQARWATDVGGEVWSSPLVHGATLVVGTHGRRTGGLVAVDQATGAVVWRLDLGAGVRSTLALHGNTAVLGTEDGRVIAVDLVARKGPGSTWQAPPYPGPPPWMGPSPTSAP